MEALQEMKKYTVEEWFELPEDRRCELIDGELYDMATPSRVHQSFVAELLVEIKNHIREKGGDCKVYPAPFGVQLDENDDTIVEPDITVVCDRDKLNDKGCVGAPDWVIEVISPSTASMDYVKKRELYMRYGVREYWIVDPGNSVVFVYKIETPMKNDTYTFEDTIRVGIYDDLAIDFKKLAESVL